MQILVHAAWIRAHLTLLGAWMYNAPPHSRTE
jgi:hypothetical protein